MLVLTVLPITGLLIQNGVIINWSLANQLGTASITNLVRGTLEITNLITAMEEERSDLVMWVMYNNSNGDSDSKRNLSEFGYKLIDIEKRFASGSID